ncbi:MAG: hypothetical protein IPM66_18265 [Acidobacteriota bacterium]|nr:MAG: hypothetical protein IPM66_18265 [Acidobacteriota bacterium]
MDMEDTNPSEAGAEPTPRRGSVVPRLLTVIGFAATIIIYLLRLDRVVGLTIDDAWYVLLAKSLAEGDGYTVINSPSPGILPLYPPGFPLILSIFYRLSPSFPENLWLLKAVSIASMIGAGWLTLVWLRRHRPERPLIAAGVAVAAMLCPPLSFLATSTVMSECFFTLLLLATIVVIERAVETFRSPGDRSRAWTLLLAGAILAAYSFLTRSIAVALIAAVFIYLLRHRLFRQGLAFAVVVMLAAGPWVIHSRLNAPTAEEQLEQGGHIVQPYDQQFWQRVASIETADRITAAELPARVWNNILEIAGLDALHIAAAPLFEELRDPYAESRKLLAQSPTDKTEGTLIFSYLLSLLMLAGFISACRVKVTLAEITLPLSIAVTVLWPWETVRFMLPLTPFLFFYLARGVSAPIGMIRNIDIRKFAPRLEAGAVILLLLVNLYGNITFLSSKLSESPLDRPQWLQSFDDAEAVFRWIETTIPKDETLVTLNPPMVYLFTGRKSVSWSRPELRWETWKRLGVRHLVWFSAYPVPPEPQQAKFPIVFRPGNVMDYRVVDLGPPENRPLWE